MVGMTGVLQPPHFTLSVLPKACLTDLTACSRGESDSALRSALRSALLGALAVLDEGPTERGGIGDLLLPPS